MRHFGIVFVFALGLGIGCAAGTAVQPQVAEAQVDEAQAPSGARGWAVETANRGAKAAALGAEGWEPFAVQGTLVYFKRPLP